MGEGRVECDVHLDGWEECQSCKVYRANFLLLIGGKVGVKVCRRCLDDVRGRLKDAMKLYDCEMGKIKPRRLDNIRE